MVEEAYRLALTAEGRRFVDQAMRQDMHGPVALPRQVVVGHMASGSLVIEDGATLDLLGSLATAFCSEPFTSADLGRVY
jgi:hypothetical protein